MKKQKVMVIGLDCASPKLIFELWKNKLPNLSRLIDNGDWGYLRSCTPPITVPAWMCMVTGKDPGALGVYGFRERDKNSYTKSKVADSSYIKEKTVWDILGKKGKKSIIIGVPPSFPVKNINGIMITDFLTPSVNNTYTYPKSISKEIKNKIGDYIFDVRFRIEDRTNLLKDLIAMTEKRFNLASYLLKNKSWNFFMMVEIGVDRIHHSFWKYFDTEHKKYEPDNEYKNAIFEYYKFIDKKIGELLEIIPKETTILVVSDHGAKKMDGVFCINEWLIQEGYLVLKKYPSKPTFLEDVNVDWSKTKAWAWGGYYGRVFLNMKGRDPQGLIEKNMFNKEKEILIKKLKKVTDEKGKVLNNYIPEPGNIYKTINGNPSDIFAFIGDLSWRCAGTVGHKTLWIFDNDTGPDDAVHDWDGVYVKYDPDNVKKSFHKDLSIFDIKSIILKQFGLK